MKNKIIILCAFLLVSFIENSKAQIKGMYVELFGNYILPNVNPALRSNVIDYARDHSFNYLILYDLGGTVFDRINVSTGSTLTTQQEALRDFIIDAKNQITDLQIGVSDGVSNGAGGPNKFFDNIVWFNNVVNDPFKAVDVVSSPKIRPIKSREI